MVYHNGALPGGGSFNRSVCVDYLYYNPDGTIQPIIQTTAGVSVPPRNDDLPVGFAAQAMAGQWRDHCAVESALGWSARLQCRRPCGLCRGQFQCGRAGQVCVAGISGNLGHDQFQSSGARHADDLFLAGGRNSRDEHEPWCGRLVRHGPYLAHRYGFIENGGSSVADSAVVRRGLGRCPTAAR